VIVEFQIDANKFATVFRQTVAGALVCQVPTFQLGSDTWRVIGFDVGATTLRRSEQPTGTACIHGESLLNPTRASVPESQIVQTIIPKLAKEADIIANNGVGTPNQLPGINLDLVFDLAMNTCATTANELSTLLISFKDVDQVGQSLPELTDALRQQIHDQRLVLPTQQISTLLRPIDVINAHLSLGHDSAYLGVRLELWDPKWAAASGDTARTLDYWLNFYSGDFAPHLGAGGSPRDWSVFIDRGVIVPMVHDLFQDALKNNSSFRLHSGPDASWQNNNGTARVHVTFNGDAINACRCFFEDSDVNADITADIDLWVDTSNALRQDVYVNSHANFWDALCCEVTSALFWPFVGIQQLDRGNINGWEYLAGFLPFAALIGTIVAIGQAASHMQPPPGFQRVDPDDGSHLFREIPIDFGSGSDFGSLTLDNAAALDDPAGIGGSGLLLSGAVGLKTRPSTTLADVQVPGLEWGLAGSCSGIQLAASASVQLASNPPQFFYICDVEVQADPLGVFGRDEVLWEWGKPEIDVGVTFFPPGYLTNPYPCRLLVVTSAGMRILSIAPPPHLTPEQIQQFQSEAERARLACFVEQDPFYQTFHQYNPRWSIDPGPEDIAAHAWQAVVNGLAPGENVQITGANNQVLGVATAGGTGVALVSALVAPNLQSAELGLQRIEGSSSFRLPGEGVLQKVLGAAGFEDKPGSSRGQTAQATGPAGLSGGGSGADGTKRRRGILFRQVLLERRAEIGLQAPGIALSAAAQSGTVALAVVLPATVQIYDVSNPLFPVTLSAWPGHRVSGLVSFAGDLWVWGEAGIRELAAGYRMPYQPFTRCEQDAVFGAAATTEYLYVLRHNCLTIYDTGLCEVGRCEVDGYSLAIAGRALAVATAEGVVIFDLSEPRNPHRTHCVALSQSGFLITPSVFGGRAVIGVSHADGDRLLDVSHPDAPFEALRFSGPAWYANTAQSGRVSASFNANRTAVVLHSVVKSARF
jgi:hypothetical protein